MSSTSAPDFAHFFASAWPRLLRTTYAVAGDRQLAEDTLQTAFAKAYAAWGACLAPTTRWPTSGGWRSTPRCPSTASASRRRESTVVEHPERLLAA